MNKKISCDYFIVGSGAASLSYIDTLLTELPSVKIVLIDQKAAPGGHWNDAYGFVKLHAPSLLYGIASRQLEGNWLKLVMTKFMLPWNHRATKLEILNYFQTYVDDKVAAGQLEYYPSSYYDFSSSSSSKTHKFSASGDADKTGTDTTYEVDVRIKFVNGVLGETQVPSQAPLRFPVDEGVRVMTSDDIYNEHLEDKSFAKNKQRHYIILGAGKTGMDAIIYLQRNMYVKASQISWVIPNDVWMLNRGQGTPWSWARALQENDCDRDKAALALEEQGSFVRLSKDFQPTKFKFPVIGTDELTQLRMVSKFIRLGRVTGIRRNADQITVEFGSNNDPWIPPYAADDIVFVHCASPGPFNGNDPKELFVSDQELNLWHLFAPPISLSMSVTAYLEAARYKGTLDLNFGQKLLQTKKNPEAESPMDTTKANDVLKQCFSPFQIGMGEIKANKEQFNGIINLATFIALADLDPEVVYKWLQGNRLSFIGVPGFKSGIYESLEKFVEKWEVFGFTEDERQRLELVRDKLKPIEGK